MNGDGKDERLTSGPLRRDPFKADRISDAELSVWLQSEARVRLSQFNMSAN